MQSLTIRKERELKERLIMQDSKIEISKIKRKKTHFPQIVEDCVSDCQRLSSARTRTRNSFSSFNPPLAVDPLCLLYQDC